MAASAFDSCTTTGRASVRNVSEQHELWHAEVRGHFQSVKDVSAGGFDLTGWCGAIMFLTNAPTALACCARVDHKQRALTCQTPMQALRMRMDMMTHGSTQGFSSPCASVSARASQREEREKREEPEGQRDRETAKAREGEGERERARKTQKTATKPVSI